MTIKVYDSKVYGKTIYMRYGTIEDEGCTVICVGCPINIVHLSSLIVQYLMETGFLVISYMLLSSISGGTLSRTFWGILKR